MTKLNAAGSALVYSTYLGGGSGCDEGNGIAVDGSGNAYVTGYTASADFPTTPGASQTVYAGSGQAFVTRLNAAGSALVYSTYLGGRLSTGLGIAVDGSGNAYVTGQAETPAPRYYDAFVTKLTAVDALPPPLVPRLTISDVTFAEGNNGTTAFVFIVRLSAPSTQTVTVNYGTADGGFENPITGQIIYGALAGSDYQAASGTLTFAPGETYKTITVLVYGDKKREPMEWFDLNLSGATNATIWDGLGVGTIWNDDK